MTTFIVELPSLVAGHIHDLSVGFHPDPVPCPQCKDVSAWLLEQTRAYASPRSQAVYVAPAQDPLPMDVD